MVIVVPVAFSTLEPGSAYPVKSPEEKIGAKDPPKEEIAVGVGDIDPVLSGVVSMCFLDSLSPCLSQQTSQSNWEPEARFPPQRIAPPVP